MGAAIHVIGEQRCRLGESPVWDPDLAALFWVDAVDQKIWRHDPQSGLQSALSAPDLLGSVVLGSAGHLVVGLRHQVCRLDIAAGVFSPVLAPPSLADFERLNDGKTDRDGRLVIGTLVPHGQPACGKVFRLAVDAVPTILIEGMEIANAICFSPAGDRLYVADSLKMAIWSFPYDRQTGALGPREVLIDTQPLGSAPDGATVDCEGRIWVALVQAGQLACIAPSGRLERLIDLPVPFPSCPAFGGPRLDTLFVTSIADSGGRLTSDHPDAGRLIAIDGLDAAGLVEARCAL